MNYGGVVHGIGITALVDFGATATMMSDAIYSKIQSYKRQYLKTFEGRIQAANGDDTNTLATAEFTCTFSGRQFTLPAKNANINAEVVLGLNFMLKFQCYITI